ncbi:tripartite tricarboxylate transporter permease [Pseudonocardia kunmingensis]|uniref:Putative tricarboxylic transport membrane protein n=1 Tax=Pseudonocardia kunmingensis TaxID=630975 RepID=A0A543D3R2_9PSEU|nr:tripartite tricarboxylate transporter permease [Pseudonocardia kunmingensis]TQM03986.1 putative tricarboxylic transport membrane protein [Pseudonocardia kunmingensis]
MSALLEGVGALLDPTIGLCLLIGVLLGTLVGAIPGVTATMAVALAAGFTLTLEPLQGLAVLLAIYVAAQFGDRVPAILINTPGTPASIATTFDGYPLAKQGRAGVALTSSALVSAFGSVAGILILVFAAQPLAGIALQFGPAEMFALVVFGLTMMVGVSGGKVAKGLVAGVVGLLLGTVGRDPITGDQRFTLGLPELSSGIPFIAAIVGLFGIAEVFNQIVCARRGARPALITQLGSWWPSRSERRELRRPAAIGAGVGAVVGVIPAAGGDIAGVIAWDQARRASKHPEKFGKGSLEGLAAPDTASTATMGGSVTTTLALGVPGDSVMAVMLGSMIIWGLQPGPSLFVNSPDLVFSLATIMLVATAVTLGLSLLRLQGVVKLLALPQRYLWAVIITFCMVGTFAVQNNPFDVALMLVFGVLGLGMRRFGFPAGPMVLGLILGPLAESNLRRALLIDGASGILSSPIALALLALSVLAVAGPRLRAAARSRRRRTERDRDPVAG